MERRNQRPDRERHPPSKLSIGFGMTDFSYVRKRVNDVDKEARPEEEQVKSDRRERREKRQKQPRQCFDTSVEEDIGLPTTVMGAAERAAIVTEPVGPKPAPQLLAYGQVVRDPLGRCIRPGQLVWMIESEQSEQGLAAEEKRAAGKKHIVVNAGRHNACFMNPASVLKVRQSNAAGTAARQNPELLLAWLIDPAQKQSYGFNIPGFEAGWAGVIQW